MDRTEQTNLKPETPYRCIIQLTSSDPKVYKSILRQIENLLLYLPQKITVEMVCHGASSLFCRKDNNPNIDEIMALKKRGVEILVCAKMMEGAKLTEQDLIPTLTIIPSGIGQLVVRQQEGWSYVKAGF
ncbi:DsrE family protein [Dyadobacter tibetensis]|uniref:DsrE family protein n=1 Tax=Dyadobacter tibetensis TaxID=1211851 RepID=UPI0004716435|nr:DsrE family protein [Dyadobacter tibetensis]